jgi:uncharacterized membrane protein
MPFPTGLIVQYGQEQIAVVIYAGTLIITGLALDLIWWYASHNHRLVDKNIDPKLVTFVHQRTLLAPVIYLVAIGLSFISLFVAKLCFVAVALLYILPNPLDHYHHSGLYEQVKVWD